MQQHLKVCLVQTDLEWENPTQNRLNLENKINTISEDVDVIILPEMFTSGFTMNASEVAETMEGDTIAWLKNMAKAKDAAFIGSLVISEYNNFYNRLVCIEPNGNIIQYDKKHTFTLAGEHKVYTSGKEKVFFNYKGWKICPMVCYDLRFPVWARNTEDYDVLIYVANWPKVRVAAWDALLKARAIENMVYCIGVNRVGFDGNKHEYVGHSAVYDLLGNKIDHIAKAEERIDVVNLDKEHIQAFRTKLNFLNDRDDFTLKG